MRLLLTRAFAATWSVPADGTLEAVSQLLSDGDVIELTEDSTGCLDAGRSVTLRGTHTLTADGCENLLVVNDGETLTVEGLNLVNEGGRAVGVWSSHLVLEGTTIEGAGGALQGGAVYLYGGSLVVRDATFSDNEGTDGGAIAAVWVSSVLIEDSHFVDNTGTASGGGLFTYAVQGPVEVLGSTFTGNLGQDGGAIHSQWYHQLRVQDSELTGNHALGYGGAIVSWYQGDLEVLDSELTDNVADGNSGGAISAYAGTRDDFSVLIEGSLLSGNEAVGHGGAVDISWFMEATLQDNTLSGNLAAGAGGGVRAYAVGDLMLQGNALASNHAGGDGGGLESAWSTTETLRNNVFSGNEGHLGGALHRYAGYDALIENNHFIDNVAAEWGAVYLHWSYGRFVNNLVQGSTGTGLYIAEAYTLANTTWGYNAFWANDLAGGGFAHPGPSDVVQDPLLQEDGRLSWLSPLRDAGDPSLVDPDGSPSDIGAWGGALAADEDLDGDGFSYFADCDDSDPDLAEPRSWYADSDGDGYPGGEAILACFQPEGAFASANDCDDGDPEAFPGALEHRGDGVDQDCDGLDPEPNDPDRSEPLRACQPVAAPVWLFLTAGLLVAGRRR